MKDIKLIGQLLVFKKKLWSEQDIFLAKCLWFSYDDVEGTITADLSVTLKTAVLSFLSQCFPAFMSQQQYAESKSLLSKDIGAVYRDLREHYEREVAPSIPYWSSLRKHQKNVLISIYKRRVNLLGMQMRTGKSITSASHSIAIGARRTVILCYSIGKWNWVMDMTSTKWNRDSTSFDQLDFTVLDSSKRKSYYAFNERFVICNYDAAEKYLRYLITNGDRVTDHIIIDECQAVKSQHSNRNHVVSELIKGLPNARITLMSGTYIMNRVDDAFAYLRLVGNPLGEKKSEFDRRFLVKTGSYNKVVGAKDSDILSACMSNFSIRVLFSDCSDMPPKQHIQLHFPIGEWRDEYNKAIKRAIEDHGKRVSSSWIHSVNNIMAQSKVSGTIEQALQLVDEGSKVVIFTSYNEPLNMMSRALTEKEIGFVRVDGNVVDAKEKMVLATRFQQDPECMVFIANIKAAGHTIPLHVSSVIFILNQTLTPKEIEQAIARLEHIDKKDPITIYYPTCLGESNEETVDMRLTSLNAGKLLDIDAVVDGGKDINNLENISEMLFESMKKEYENYESNTI